LVRSELHFLTLIGSSLIIYTNLNLFNFIVTGATGLLDLVSRSNPNDSLINDFNFFWTSFTYLPTFFFAFLGVFITLFSTKFSLAVSTIFAPLFLLYNYELLDFLTVNAHWYVRDGSLSGINLLLSNNLNKYHPFLFYISVFLLVPAILATPSLYLKSTVFHAPHFLSLHEGLITRTLVINLFALFLGSWWALQEGTWGGWWNWDASEVLGLLVSLGSLQYLHTRQTFFNLVQVTEKFTLGVVLFVFSYFFIQLNFDLVSHNFGSKFFFFFNNNLFFLEILSLLLITVILILNQLYYWRTQLFALTTTRRSDRFLTLQWLGIWSLYLAISIVAISSFLPLLNYFIWSYFAINSFNFRVHLPLLITPIFLLTLLTFSSFRYSIIICIGSVSCPSIPLTVVLLLLTPFRWSLVSLQHSLLLGLIALNLVSYTLNFVYWYPSMIYEEVAFTQNTFFIKQECLTCDTAFIDKLTLYQTNVFYNGLSSWNTFYSSNAPLLNSFLLGYDTSTHFNYYLLSDGWLSPALFIETGYLNNLFETTILTVLGVTHFLTTQPHRPYY